MFYAYPLDEFRTLKQSENLLIVLAGEVLANNDVHFLQMNIVNFIEPVKSQILHNSVPVHQIRIFDHKIRPVKHKASIS